MFGFYHKYEIAAIRDIVVNTMPVPISNQSPRCSNVRYSLFVIRCFLFICFLKKVTEGQRRSKKKVNVSRPTGG